MAVIWLECYSFSVIGIFVEKVNSKAHKIAPKTKTELNQKLNWGWEWDHWIFYAYKTYEFYKETKSGSKFSLRFSYAST